MESISNVFHYFSVSLFLYDALVNFIGTEYQSGKVFDKQQAILLI